MNGLTRRTGELYDQSEHSLGRSWPLWAIALVFYSGAAFVVLTRVRLPTPLHLIVFLMAAIVLVLTAIRIEWAVMGLALMIPFARPGFSLGAAKTFHVSGFNVAVFGVWVVYTLRYLLEKGTVGQGPFIRRTPIDPVIAIFVFLVSAATFVGLSNMEDPLGRAQILLYFKETVFYFAWLYLVHTLIRNPTDLRRFGMLLASSGLLVAAIGLINRMSGAAMSVGVSEAELEGGVVGGQTAGGWLGLVHPNFYGAFLIVSMPIWFFAVDHLKRVIHRTLAQAAVLLGFVGLLFTYSRSAWGGMLMGLGSQAVLHPRDPSPDGALRRPVRRRRADPRRVHDRRGFRGTHPDPVRAAPAQRVLLAPGDLRDGDGRPQGASDHRRRRGRVLVVLRRGVGGRLAPARPQRPSDLRVRVRHTGGGSRTRCCSSP